MLSALCFDVVNKEYPAFSILRIFHAPHSHFPSNPDIVVFWPEITQLLSFLGRTTHVLNVFCNACSLLNVGTSGRIVDSLQVRRRQEEIEVSSVNLYQFSPRLNITYLLSMDFCRGFVSFLRMNTVCDHLRVKAVCKRAK